MLGYSVRLICVSECNTIHVKQRLSYTHYWYITDKTYMIIETSPGYEMIIQTSILNHSSNKYMCSIWIFEKPLLKQMWFYV